MIAESKSVRVDPVTHRFLKFIYKNTGIEMQHAIKEAVQNYWPKKLGKMYDNNLGGNKNGNGKRDTRKA